MFGVSRDYWTQGSALSSPFLDRVSKVLQRQAFGRGGHQGKPDDRGEHYIRERAGFQELYRVLRGDRRSFPGGRGGGRPVE